MARAAGFTLIESLLALVVLSIGLLGLGQLQARLWLAATEVHTSTSAYTLGENLLETGARPWLGAAAAQLRRRPPGPPVRAEIRRYQSPAADGVLATLQVDLHWRTATGEQSVSLARSRDPRLDPRDTRWLLAQP